MDRIIRFTALALAAFTLVWLSGCGEPVDVEGEARAKQQAIDAQAAAEQAVLNEGPTPIVPEDYWRVEKKEDVGGLRVYSQTMLRTEGNWNLMQVEHNLEIQGNNPDQGYPKSHEEFVKLVVDEWGMPLPRLKEPYEVWYDAETHQVLKRPKQDAPAETP
jgi:hypothetical protein